MATVLAASVGLILVLMIGGPLILVIGFIDPPQGNLVNFIGGAADRILVGGLLVYVYAVISGYLLTAILQLLSTLFPAGWGRFLAIWVLCFIYLFGTGIYLLTTVPLLLALYLGAAFISSGILGPGTLGMAWLALNVFVLVHFLVVLASYILADSFSPLGSPGVTNNSERTWRGVMIGSNAGMNFLLTLLIFGAVLEPFVGTAGLIGGLGAGVIAALISFLGSTMPTQSNQVNGAVRFIMGWTSWLLPMSWPVVLLGWIACLINMLSHVLLGLPYHKWFGLFVINSGRIHWQNGTNFIEGGLASNLWDPGSRNKPRGLYRWLLRVFSWIDHHARLSSAGPACAHSHLSCDSRNSANRAHGGYRDHSPTDGA